MGAQRESGVSFEDETLKESQDHESLNARTNAKWKDSTIPAKRKASGRGGSRAKRAGSNGGSRKSSKANNQGQCTEDEEMEQRRMRRLVRNRISAQQARERKKAYLSGLEGKLKSMEERSKSLQDAVLRLQQENASLRRLLRTALSEGESDSHGDVKGH